MLSEKELLDANIDVKVLIRNYADIFDEITDNIIHQFSQRKCIELQISNTIAYNAFQLLLTIVESKQLNSAYWELVSELKIEPLDLNFYSYLLTLSCKASLAEDEIHHKIIIQPTAKMIQRKESLISKGSAPQYEFEADLIVDPKYNNEQTSLRFLERFDQVQPNFL